MNVETSSGTSAVPRKTRLFGVPEHLEQHGEHLEGGAFAGDYRVDRHLADGGMASVYEATHPLIGKRAAVKVLNGGLARNALQVERFLTEARAVNQIQHPNIVDIFAFGQLDDGRHYFVMELLGGETLYARMERKPLELAETLDVLVQICDALEAAHAHQIAHLDLKPENIFLVPVRNARPRVKLLDFGIAKLMGAESLKVSGDFCGTPDYASPEQAQGLESIDCQSDVYSLGVVAYELVCGQRPFDAEQPIEILWKHIRQRPAKPSTHRPISEELEALVLAMLDKEADKRPTMGQVRDQLLALKTPSMEMPILPATPSQPIVIEVPKKKPNAALLGAVAAVIAIVCGLGVRMATHHGRVENRAEAMPEPAPVAVVVPAPTPVAVAPTPAPVALAPKKHLKKRTKIVAVPLGADYVLDYGGHPR